MQLWNLCLSDDAFENLDQITGTIPEWLRLRELVDVATVANPSLRTSGTTTARFAESFSESLG